MLKVKTVLRFGKVLLGSLLIAGLAGPAFAGDVWSWRTEDGAYAFTDDSKRIPAKHKAEAKRKSMGKLTRYGRYTEVSADVEKPYADRIRERRAGWGKDTGFQVPLPRCLVVYRHRIVRAVGRCVRLADAPHAPKPRTDIKPF